MKAFSAFVFIILLLSLGCAQQTTPTGGPKDTIPPTLISVQPPNQKTNFTSNVIELTFDEYINLNNPAEQLLITPSIGKDFEVSIRKKTVRLELQTELEDSTTYTINFRESVQDVTEKNPVENLKYVFSTGSYLDSLTITGSVHEILNGKPSENATVALYTDPDTFLIFDHTPQYATRTDKSGSFTFENLKADEYYIYAFNDKNNNLKVDSKTEKYGFLVSPILLNPLSNPSVTIPLFSLDARELKITSARPTNTYFAIRFSKAVISYSIKPANDQDSIYLSHTITPDQTAIQVYMPEIQNDSLPINLHALDSLGSQLDTMLFAKPNSRAATPEPFTITITEPPSINSSNLTLSMAMQFTKPVEYLNLDSMVYLIDSLHQLPFNSLDLNWINNNVLQITKTIPDTLLPSPDEQAAAEDFRTSANLENTLINEIQFRPGAFISIENDSSRAITQKVKYLLPNNTGVLLTTTSVSDDSIIFQVIDRDLNVIQERHQEKNATFHFIPPGDYLVRLIIDQNGNGKWDPGNFYLRKQPEPVYFYRNDEGEPLVNLKANWELGPLLITDD